MSKTDLAALRKELSVEAEGLRQSIAVASAPKISLNRDGDFTGPDGEILGDTIRVVVVDFVTAHKYYPYAYDPNNIQSPECFAIGRNLADLKPSPNAPSPQNARCATCELNQFGSRGNAKACKNIRELGVILERDFQEDEPTILKLSVPPSAIKSFDGYVSSVISMLGAPPIATTVEVAAVQKPTYATMVFRNAETNENLEHHYQFKDTAYELISREPDLTPAEPAPPAKQRPMMKKPTAKR